MQAVLTTKQAAMQTRNPSNMDKSKALFAISRQRSGLIAHVEREAAKL